MTTTLKTRTKQRIDVRDEKAISIFKEIAKSNMGQSLSSLEDAVAAEMAKQGYDLTTRMGVHGVLVRRGIIKEG